MSTVQRGPGASPLAFVFVTVLIDLLGFGIVIPLLPVYSAAHGATGTELAWLFASFSGMQFLFAPFWGRLSDRIGRKPVLVGGLFGTAASYVLFALADSMPLLFASRLLAGFFGANISTAQAYIADVTRPEDRARGMGLIGAAFGLGFTLGPLFGGELSQISPAAPGWFAAGLSATAAAFGWWALREPARHTGTRIFSADHVKTALAEPRIGTLYLLSFLFVSSFAAFESMFVLFGLAKFPEVFGVSTAIAHATHDEAMRAAPIAGRYLAGIGIVAAILQGGLTRRIVKRFGETLLVTAGPLILALAFAIVGFAPTWSLVIAGCLVMPFGFGINNPALNSLVSRATPPERQGAFLGLNQSVLSLARVCGPLGAGLVFTHIGPSAPFFGATLVLLACTAVAAWYHRRYHATFPRTSAA